MQSKLKLKKMQPAKPVNNQRNVSCKHKQKH